MLSRPEASRWPPASRCVSIKLRTSRWADDDLLTSVLTVAVVSAIQPKLLSLNDFGRLGRPVAIIRRLVEAREKKIWEYQLACLHPRSGLKAGVPKISTGQNDAGGRSPLPKSARASVKKRPISVALPQQFFCSSLETEFFAGLARTSL